MVLVAEPKRRVPVHHKKRTGQHHKSGKHYSKTYWPYLPLLLIVMLGVVLSHAWNNQNKSVLGYATSVVPDTLLSETNAQRLHNGDGRLQNNADLTKAAQARANDMVAHNYWSHTSPTGQQAWQFISANGYHYAVAGENLAYGFGSSDAIVNAWMRSSEHRANILNNQYADVGFGIANSANFDGHGAETIVVAMYGAPAASGTTQSSDVLGAASTRQVARIQLLSSGTLLLSLTSAIAGAAIAIFIIRHGLLWRRAVVRSEAFVMRHPALDLVLVSVGILGFILTRTSGAIH